MRYRLLDLSLSEDAENKINSIKNEKRKEDLNLTELDLDYIQEIKSIRNDTENWRYSLNLRGLIYYLNYVKNKESVILEILTNPILLKHANFLYNCKFFNDFGYPLVRKMIDIAQDYPNVFNSEYYDDKKLKQSIRDRYLDEIRNYYLHLNYNNFSLTKDIPQEFKDYFDFMLEDQNNDLKELIQSNEKILNQLR
jgi:hypothetical protein